MTPRCSPAEAITGLLAVLLLTGCTAANDQKTEGQTQPSPTGATVTAVADPVSGTYTGTQTIELGAPPDEASHIRLELKCLSAGTLVLEDGFEAVCPTGLATTVTSSSTPLSAGQTSVTVTAGDPTTKYELEAVYENGASVR